MFVFVIERTFLFTLVFWSCRNVIVVLLSLFLFVLFSLCLFIFFLLFLFFFLSFLLSGLFAQNIYQLVLHFICNFSYQDPHCLLPARSRSQLVIFEPMLFEYPNYALNHRLLRIRCHMIEWIDVVLCKVVIQPHLCPPFLIKPNQRTLNLKSPKPLMQTLKTKNGFRN